MQCRLEGEMSDKQTTTTGFRFDTVDNKGEFIRVGPCNCNKGMMVVCTQVGTGKCLACDGQGEGKDCYKA